MTTIERIAEAIAVTEGKQPHELTFALQDYVDGDAIQLLADHDGNSWMLEFDVPKHTVRITGQGAIFVDERRQQTPAVESDTPAMSD